MNFEAALGIVGEEPVFETAILLAGDVDPDDIRRQLSRWTASGKIVQLRRGLYALAPPYQKSKPHPFVIANRLVPASYVSAESALAHYGMIPEHVPVTVSVTSTRPVRRHGPFGSFDHHHVTAGLFWGYRSTALGNGQTAFVARPEKAILDLIHLTDGGDAQDYLDELRLQNLEQLDLATLDAFVRRANRPKLVRAARIIGRRCREDVESGHA